MTTRRHNQPPEKFTPPKIGWRPKEWALSCGVSRAHVYNLLNEGRIASVRDGKARIITTSPTDYLTALAGE